MTHEELIEKIKEWGREKGIDNIEAQTVKLSEEVGELAHEICRSRYNSAEAIDAMGDIQVVLIILSDIMGVDYTKALFSAYQTIAMRTGRTENGKFIKDE